MKRIAVFVITTLLAFASLALAQQAAEILAKPEEQVKIKPLVAELTKAFQERTTKRATLPEAQKVKDAEVALEKANKELDEAAEKLPETAAWKTAYAKLLDTSFDIMAKQGLSSRQYQPRITDKGELAFIPFKPTTP